MPSARGLFSSIGRFLRRAGRATARTARRTARRARNLGRTLVTGAIAAVPAILSKLSDIVQPQATTDTPGTATSGDDLANGVGSINELSGSFNSQESPNDASLDIEILKAQAEAEAQKKAQALREQILKASQELTTRSAKILDRYGLAASEKYAHESEELKLGIGSTESLTKGVISSIYKQKVGGDTRLNTIMKLLGASNELLGHVQINVHLLLRSEQITEEAKLLTAQAMTRLSIAEKRKQESINADLLRKSEDDEEKHERVLRKINTDKIKRAANAAATHARNNWALDLAAVMGVAPMFTSQVANAFSDFIGNFTGSDEGDEEEDEDNDAAWDRMIEDAEEDFGRQLTTLVTALLPDLMREPLERAVAKVTSAVGETAAGKAVSNAAETATKKVEQLLAKSALGRNTEKVLKKIGSVLTAKAAAGTALKKVPIVGAGFGVYYAAKRFSQGDYLAGVGELFSGVASAIPGVGTAASVATDLALLGTDLWRATDAIEKGDIDELIKLDWALGDILEIVNESDPEDPIRKNFSERFKTCDDVKEAFGGGSDVLLSLVGLGSSLPEESPLRADFFQKYDLQGLLNEGIDIADLVNVCANFPSSPITKELLQHPEIIQYAMSKDSVFNTVERDLASIATLASDTSPFGQTYFALMGKTPDEVIAEWDNEKGGIANTFSQIAAHPLDVATQTLSSWRDSIASAVGLGEGPFQLGEAQDVGELAEYARGGKIVGPSHEEGGVKLPQVGAEVEGGEYIVNKDSTEKHEALLDAINQDTLESSEPKEVEVTATEGSNGEITINNGGQEITVDLDKLPDSIILLTKSIIDLRESLVTLRSSQYSTDLEISDKVTRLAPLKSGDEEQADGEEVTDSYESANQQVSSRQRSAFPAAPMNLIGRGVISSMPNNIDGTSAAQWMVDNIEGRQIVYSQSDGYKDLGDKVVTDCSAATQQAYLQATGLNIGRNTDAQFNGKYGQVVDQGMVSIDGTLNDSPQHSPNPQNLKPGDLLFYRDKKGSKIGLRKFGVAHVEMYLGDGQMIGTGNSSPSRKRRRVNALDKSHYYIGAKRYLQSQKEVGVSDDRQPEQPTVISEGWSFSPVQDNYQSVPSFQETSESFPSEDGVAISTNSLASSQEISSAPSVTNVIGGNTFSNIDNSTVNIIRNYRKVSDDARKAEL